jgi:hypothetical protein
MRSSLWKITRLPALLLFAIVPSDVFAFLISTHRLITESALAQVGTKSPAEGREHDKLIKGATETDLVEGGLPPGRPYDGRYHFDTLDSYIAIQKNFREMLRLARENVDKKLPDPWAFGKILHAIQDFYSHSNYIPVYREYRASRKQPVGAIPTLEEVLINPAAYPDFQRWLPRLRTGQYPNVHSIPTATDHGWFWITGGGMNNDSLIRPFYIEARETAERATLFYLQLYRNEPSAWRDWLKVWGPLAP